MVLGALSTLKMTHQPHDPPRIVIISGGTASNSLVNTFSSLSPHISYLLPISDNGGSTSELMRVIGGPAIGDLRSRITRLIPNQSEGLRDLLSHRLSEFREDAKQEWNEILEGTHPLWYPVESQCRELIRPFFTHIHVELLKRSRPTKEFRFESASVGNLFLTGVRLFCGSLDSAIELFLRVTLVPSTIEVLPALNTNFSHHISAQLENRVIITGQSQISHPSEVFFSEPANINTPFPVANSQPSIYIHPPVIASSTQCLIPGYASSSRFKSSHSVGATSDTSDDEDAHLPFSHPDLKTSQLHFSKNVTTPLVSPIRRIFYINPYGQEIHPRASSRVIRTLEKADAVIYSIGSLFTSTVPVVILQGFASSIQDHQNSKKKKILLLNGSLDRETAMLNTLGFVRAIIGACLYSEQGSLNSIYYHNSGSTSSLTSNFQSTALPQNSSIAGQSVHGGSFGIQSTRYPTTAQFHDLSLSNSTPSSTNSHYQSEIAPPKSVEDPYDPESITHAQWNKYITHIVYLEHSQLAPTKSDIAELHSRGIECTCVGSEQGSVGEPDPSHYSSDILQKVLSSIINS